MNYLLRKIIFLYIIQMKNYLNRELRLERKVNLINTRFSYEGYANSVGFNRKLILKKIALTKTL